MGQEPPAPPPNFQLIPVKTEQEPSPLPTPAPGPSQKPTLDILDKQVLRTVDDHAIQVRNRGPFEKHMINRACTRVMWKVLSMAS